MFTTRMFASHSPWMPSLPSLPFLALLSAVLISTFVPHILNTPLQPQPLQPPQPHPLDGIIQPKYLKKRRHMSHPHLSPYTSQNNISYTLGKVLGKGGYGTVYQAMRIHDGYPVAIKCSDPARAKNKTHVAIHKEYQFMQLYPENPFVMHAGDFVTYESGHACLVMDHVATHGSLQQWYDHHKDQVETSLGFIKSTLLRVLLGLDHVHAYGIAQRDIKMKNILLFQYPDSPILLPKISDFGISVSTHPAISTQQERNKRTGTKGYRPPEYHDQTDILDPTKVDIYSLGIVLRTFLTQVDPKVYLTLDMQEQERVDAMVTGDAQALMAWMMKEDPAKRCRALECAQHAWFDDVRVDVLEHYARLW